MARVCDVCGKSKKSGNNVTFSHRAIKRTWTPNLRRVRVYDENGTPKRMSVCTRCLRSGLVDRNRPVNSFLTEEVEEVNVESTENETVETTDENAAVEEVAETTDSETSTEKSEEVNENEEVSETEEA